MKTLLRQIKYFLAASILFFPQYSLIFFLLVFFLVLFTIFFFWFNKHNITYECLTEWKSRFSNEDFEENNNINKNLMLFLKKKNSVLMLFSWNPRLKIVTFILWGIYYDNKCSHILSHTNSVRIDDNFRCIDMLVL